MGYLCGKGLCVAGGWDRQEEEKEHFKAEKLSKYNEHEVRKNASHHGGSTSLYALCRVYIQLQKAVSNRWSLSRVTYMLKILHWLAYDLWRPVRKELK
jgi:hypothetical protein